MSRDALIVGINSYQYLNSLKAPASDAEAIAQMLEQNGDFTKVQRLPEAIQEAGDKKPVNSELEVRDVARKSIVAKNLIQKNTVIKEDMLSFKRPGTGISPKYFTQVVGKIAKENIHADEMILFEKLK